MRKKSNLNNQEMLEEAVKRNKSVAGVLKDLGLKHTGGNHAVFKKYVVLFNIDVSHFTGANWRKGIKGGYPQKKTEDILNNKETIPNSHLRKRLIKEGVLEDKCYKCGVRDWMGESLSKHLHHKDGNNENNARENLENHCPNCHSQTETYAKIKNSPVDQRQSQGS